MQNKLNPLTFCLALLALFCTRTIFAQTNVGITAGVDLSKIILNTEPLIIQTGDSTYANADIIYGIRTEQRIAKSFFLSFQFDYTRKRIAINSFTFYPNDQFGFSRYRTALALHWMPYKWLSVGTGPSASYSPNLNAYFENKLWDDTPYKRKELGAMFFTGFYYRHLLLECNYYQGMKISEVQGSTFQPLRSINFTLSYLVKLHRKKKGDKTRRERF